MHTFIDTAQLIETCYFIQCLAFSINLFFFGFFLKPFFFSTIIKMRYTCCELCKDHCFFLVVCMEIVGVLFQKAYDVMGVIVTLAPSAASWSAAQL